MNNFLIKLFHKFTKELFMKEQNIYTYVILRKDLPVVHQAVQAGHAAQEAAKRFGPTEKINHLIYLEVSNKSELLEAMEYLEINQIAVNAFYEPDYNRGLTAIATEYITCADKKSLLRKFPLWTPIPGEAF